ncbi:MAG TPA: carbamoyltransferase HypF, partial [Gammaproteobacteria bacterium]|nr:carbamoyltransferase HypF [Gammaproteobacteria bacterium]
MSSCRESVDVRRCRGLRLCIRGMVQGVGFRPFLWRLARDCGLRGTVRNDGRGVVVEAWGEAAALEELLHRLRAEAPPAARIEAIQCASLAGDAAPADFRIQPSRGGEACAGVMPDAATCPDCLAEILDPGNRRHRHPFAACARCGPRLSILRAMPYDRHHTSMADFPLCPACAEEYRDPGDRRFHAQPVACPDCGPRLWLEDAEGKVFPGDPVTTARRLLQAGHILAVKGLGGFHLACDASSESAVARLRARKGRIHKPFALLARDCAMVARHARLDDTARALLESAAAPVVLLPARRHHGLAPSVAPGQDSLGFMLPCTPLHHLLMEAMTAPLVFTSGNRSEAPPCITNDEARDRLAAIADYWLFHDRDIVHRLDDSVVRVMAGRPRLLRRARGYVPEGLRLPEDFACAPPLLAMGSDLKHTFCLVRDGQAVVSQHLGDLEEATVHNACQETLDRYLRLFHHRPAAVAVDLHPRYFSTRLGEQLAQIQDLPLVRVQHHHAHVAAVMAEYGLGPQARVLGVALDGLGLGDDGTLWGGEFLDAGYGGFRR